MLLKYFTAFTALILFCGCTTTSPPTKPAPAHAETTSLAQLPDASRPDTANIGEPRGTITLKDSLAFALVNSPELKAFSHELRAAEARQLQAALPPNPELDIEIEDFAGTGELRSFDSSETTIGFGQSIELADKRAKRTRVAAIERDLAEWSYRSARLDVMSRVADAFTDVLAAQEKLDLAEDLAALSERARRAVAEKVNAGKSSPVDLTRAEVAHSGALIDLERAARRLTSARQWLAAAWGSRAPAFEKAAGDLYQVTPAPAFDRLVELASENPDIARWAAERQKRRAALELERARAAPDVEISGGLKYFEESSDTAFVMGLSIPVPLFDRNQGSIREALELVAAAKHEQTAVQMQLRSSLADAYERLSTAFEETAVLKNDIVPGARSAFDAVAEGYRQGKFGYLDLLEARRTLFYARARQIEAVSTYHKARTELERLTGQSLDATSNLTETEVDK
ncbi:MAG: TolC family protein [Phycisphaerales bacterium]|nr:MAG: TolC family protein [Phycisphaerales bacterium]